VHGGIANNELGIFNEGLIYTLPDGKLNIQGTVDRPVLIRDDRIEPDHIGEWAGIRLGPASGPHTFSHMVLRSGMIGIYADSASSLTIDHSQIAYTGGPGLYARHANATISNSLFYENGSHAMALTYGGNYEVAYCTISSFGNDSEGLLLNDYYCSDALCSEGVQLNQLTGRIYNSIIIGSSKDELWMVDAGTPEQALLDVTMDHCMVVVDELLKAENFPDFFEQICTGCFTYQYTDTLFVDRYKDDYHLDTASVAEHKAIPLAMYPDDLEGTLRDVQMPDIGCYEFRE
jgi:hypothetical protein